MTSHAKARITEKRGRSIDTVIHEFIPKEMLKYLQIIIKKHIQDMTLCYHIFYVVVHIKFILIFLVNRPSICYF